MRDVPGLTASILNRATTLAAKADASRAAVTQTRAQTGAPQNTMPPARVKDGVAVLRLYDYIDPDGGYWGISALEFAAALDEAGDVTQIELRINSCGGSVWDGLAILNTLRSHDAPVRSVVDGIAASAASFIAAASDEVVMMPNSKLMIHDAMGLCIGQAVDMREYADFLDDSSSNIAEIYAARANGTVEEWRTRMTENGLMGTWYSAAQAVEAGLADRVEGEAEDDPNDPAEGTENDPNDKLTTCQCGSNGQPAAPGMEHKDACPDKPATAPPAVDDRRARHQQNRHAYNASRAPRTA